MKSIQKDLQHTFRVHNLILRNSKPLLNLLIKYGYTLFGEMVLETKKPGKKPSK
jgi:hypothetical protein